MNLLAVIGLIVLLLGVLILVGVVTGGTVVGIIACLVGVALLLSGSGRLNL